MINSVTHGKEAPIQIQIQDVEKCFDKMWQQATTNSLYNAGIQSEMLDLLYTENVKAKVAVIINGDISKRIVVNNVEMQDSVWGSLKRTNTMGILNKSIQK